MMRARTIAAMLWLPILGGCAWLPFVGGSPKHVPPATYWVYVGAEAADQIHRVRWGPDGAVVERTVPIGELLVERDGPHGLAIPRNGRHLYVTTGHGIPDGKLWQFELGSDTVATGPIPLGRFPATLDLTPDGLFAFVANFDPYDGTAPSSVSVVYAPELVEIARLETCAMPHGGRISPSGAHHYSACMMDDEVVEIDTRSFAVSRRFSVRPGAEGPIWPEQPRAPAAPEARRCSPTWTEPSVDGDRLWVACNGTDEILEIDLGGWTLVRRLVTGRGPYSLAASPDRRWLAASLRQGNAVQFFDLVTPPDSVVHPRMHRDSLIVATSASVPHGVVFSPDSRYLFASVEGVGPEPGRVDIFWTRSLERVASVEVGSQASGIAFWRMEEPVVDPAEGGRD